MNNTYKNGEIVLNEEISPNIYKIVLKGDFQGEPGQFYMIKGWNGNDPFLPRPLSIYDLEEGHISFLYEKVGRGTSILANLNKGSCISILGPLGKGYDFKQEGKIALVSGGIGIAPMLFLSKWLKVKPDLFAGFRGDMYALDEFLPYTENIYVATENGFFGYKGYIVDILEPEKYDLIMACGPNPMLKALKEKCKDIVPIKISMESRMACGVGACLGCAVETTNGIERVCKEGPVFNGEEVIFYD